MSATLAPSYMALAFLVLQGAQQGSQPAADPWIARPSAKTVESTAYQDAASRFTVDYPKKDWRVVSGGYSTLVTFAHKDGEATIVLERQELVRPLSPSSIGELFVQLQVEEIRKVDPLAGQVTGRVLEVEGNRIPAFEYQRKVSAKETENVRLYLIPNGPYLYRLVCRAEAARLPRHAAAFALVASSLRFKEPK